MNIKKGQPGYIAGQKKKYGLMALLEFAVVFLILAAGYLLTHSRLNLFTVIAVVGCLPASKMLAEFIALFPHHTIGEETAEEIKSKAALLTTAFDLVITNKDKIMPVEAIVISNYTVFGYAPNPKTDTEYAADYLKKLLEKNCRRKVTVKVLAEYVPFLSRVEGLNNMMEVSRSSDRKLEKKIRQIILSTSM